MWVVKYCEKYSLMLGYDRSLLWDVSVWVVWGLSMRVVKYYE